MLKNTLNMVFFLLTLVCGLHAQTDVKNMESSASPERSKAQSLCRRCEELIRKGLYDEALKIGEEGLSLARRTEDDRAAAECHNHLGNAHESQGSYARALEHYQHALSLRQRLGDRKGVALGYNNLGVVYDKQGDYARAADHYLKGLKIAESLGDAEAVGYGYNNLGLVFRQQGDYARAADYFSKSLTVLERVGDLQGVAYGYNNLGAVHEAQGDYVRAAEFFQKSLALCEQIADSNGVAYGRLNLALACQRLAQTERAEQYYLKSLEIFERGGDKDGVASVWGGLAEVHLAAGRIASARRYAEKGFELARHIGNVQTMRDNALTLAKTDSAAGDFHAAFEHYKLFHAYSDSMRNDEQTQQIARLESRYQFEKELEEKKRLEAAAAQAEAENLERKYMFQSLGIFAFLTLMIFSLFFLGRLNLPRWTIKGLLYVSLMMTIEFAMMLFDPLNEKYSQGLPVYKMGFNTALALAIGPLHHLAEKTLTARLMKTAAARGIEKFPAG